MKVTMPVKNLTQALNIACRNVSKRGTLPILGNALLTESDGYFSITTTDLDNWQSVTLPDSRPAMPGQITVPAHRMAQTVKACKGEVELESSFKEIEQAPGQSQAARTKLYSLAVRNGSQFAIEGLPVEEFPVIPQINYTHTAHVQIDALRTAITRVCNAQSTDDSRYVINNVFFLFTDGKLSTVATDGRRLHLQEVSCNTPFLKFDADKPWGNSVIVQSATVELIKSVLGKAPKKFNASENDMVTITWGTVATASKSDVTPDAYVSFQLCRDGQIIKITGKQVAGNYPNFRQVIPVDCLERIELDRAQFHAALKTAIMFTSERSNSVKLVLSKNLMMVTANSPEVGKSETPVPINYAGKEFAIAFNPRYLMESLESIADQATCYLELIDELSPGIFKTIAGDWLAVIMTMRLS